MYYCFHTDPYGRLQEIAIKIFSLVYSRTPLIRTPRGSRGLAGVRVNGVGVEFGSNSGEIGFSSS